MSSIMVFLATYVEPLAAGINTGILALLLKLVILLVGSGKEVWWGGFETTESVDKQSIPFRNQNIYLLVESIVFDNFGS